MKGPAASSYCYLFHATSARKHYCYNYILGKHSDLIISESTPRTEPGHLGNLQFWIEESASELQQASELQKELYVILYEYGGKDLPCRAISACRKIF